MADNTTLHYLSEEEERAIKQSIPWDSIDCKIRDLVRFANEIKGIATIQSCAGHVQPLENGGFLIDAAHVAFRTTENITTRVLFDIAPKTGVTDAGLRYFNDGTFWIYIEVDPSERSRLYDLFRELQGDLDVRKVL